MREDRPAILIAEDDAEIRHLIRARLEEAGYATRMSRNGPETIAELRHWRFAGMLLDINMPLIDGFGVLEARATIKRFPPVLMLTARHASSDVERAVALGAKDYLTKPFSEQQLLARVKRLIRTRPAPAPAAASTDGVLL